MQDKKIYTDQVNPNYIFFNPHLLFDSWLVFNTPRHIRPRAIRLQTNQSINYSINQSMILSIYLLVNQKC